MELWYTERQTEGVGITVKVRRTLCVETTPFQDLAVLETAEFGRMLVLDGMVQTTEKDEFVYHEMIAHVALQTHPSPKRVCVVGGGDGGAVREALKYESVERVTLVEIDQRVVEASKTYLPSVSAGLSDPRVELLYADGIAHVQQRPNAYDVIIVDSTEPVGPAVGLFSRDFYQTCFNSLTAEGILVAQTESPFFNAELLARAAAHLRAVFPVCRTYLASIPTYPSGLWSFTIGSKAVDPLDAAPSLESISTRYYTAGVHRACFALPRFVEEILSGNLTEEV